MIISEIGCFHWEREVGVDYDYHHSVTVDTKRELYILPGSNKLVLLKRTGQKSTFSVSGKLKGVTFISSADLYVVTDPVKDRIHLIQIQGQNKGTHLNVIKTFTNKEHTNDLLNHPKFVTSFQCKVTMESTIIVSNAQSQSVKVFDLEGKLRKVYSSMTSDATSDLHNTRYSTRLDRPMGVAVDKDGSVLVCDSENYRVVRFWTVDNVDYWATVLTNEDLGSQHPVYIDYHHDNQGSERLLVATREGDVHLLAYHI